MPYSEAKDNIMGQPDYVNPKVHKVVVISEEVPFGFTSLAAATLFVEEINADKDISQVLDLVTTALSDDPEDNLKIMSVDVYEDVYLDDEDDDEDDDSDEN